MGQAHSQVKKAIVLKITNLKAISQLLNPFCTISYLHGPIPYSVRLYDLTSLFAGKIDALLCHNWKHRVKGRDYYDYLWYLSAGVRINLGHVEARMRQSGHWENSNPLTTDTLRNLLYERFATVDMAQVTNDVRPFIRNPRALDIWSADFYTASTKSATR